MREERREAQVVRHQTTRRSYRCRLASATPSRERPVRATHRAKGIVSVKAEKINMLYGKLQNHYILGLLVLEFRKPGDNFAPAIGIMV